MFIVLRHSVHYLVLLVWYYIFIVLPFFYHFIPHSLIKFPFFSLFFSSFSLFFFFFFFFFSKFILLPCIFSLDSRHFFSLDFPPTLLHFPSSIPLFSSPLSSLLLFLASPKRGRTQSGCGLVTAASSRH